MMNLCKRIYSRVFVVTEVSADLQSSTQSAVAFCSGGQHDSDL